MFLDLADLRGEALQIFLDLADLRGEALQILLDLAEVRREAPQIFLDLAELRGEALQIFLDLAEVRGGALQIFWDVADLRGEALQIFLHLAEVRREAPQIFLDLAELRGEAWQVFLDLAETRGEAPQIFLDLAELRGEAPQIFLDLAELRGEALQIFWDLAEASDILGPRRSAKAPRRRAAGDGACAVLRHRGNRFPSRGAGAQAARPVGTNRAENRSGTGVAGVCGAEDRDMTKQGDRSGKLPGEMNLGGRLRSLGGFGEPVSKLAEQGEIHRTGELETKSDAVRAVYGVSVRVGGVGGPRVEPFGNVKTSDKGPAVVEVREPLIDVFDEEDHLLVIAELPGLEAKNIKLEVRDDVLEISGGQRDRRYHKEVLLPAVVDGAAATSNHHNGVFELKLPKKAG
jgi:HSP20 family protein